MFKRGRKEKRMKRMLKDIEAVIFDLDGTLIDSMWMWRDIDREYLGRFRISLPDDLQESIEGMSFSETANYFKTRFSLPDSIEKIKADWNEMSWEKYEKKVPLKQGVKRFLEFLKQNHILMGISTSNSRALVEMVMEVLDIKSFFQVVVTACEVNAGKPAPDVYLKAAQLLDVKSEHCLVFEDIPNGIRAGKNAKMKVCAVEDEYSLYMTEEKKRLADYYIVNFDDIFEDRVESCK